MYNISFIIFTEWQVAAIICLEELTKPKEMFLHCNQGYKKVFQFQHVGVRGPPQPTNNSWDASRVSVKSTQFWHYLPGDDIRFQG